MRKTQIIVEVRGGLVQAVFCSNKNANVEVLDHDNAENCTDEELIEEQLRATRLETEAKKLHVVF